MRVIECQSCHLPILKGRNGLRKSRDYHDHCKPAIRKPRKRRVVELTEVKVYGRDWPARSAACRIHDNNTCVLCSYKPAGRRGLPVHHLVPRGVILGWSRRREGFGLNDSDNLITLCVPCHGRARPADDCAKRADFIGWAAEMRRLCGSNGEMVERFSAAAKHYGIPVFWRE